MKSHEKVPRRYKILSRVSALSVIEGWLDERGTMGGDDYHARLGSLIDEADRAEDAADERALAEDASRSRLTSPVLERRSDALKGFTIGAKALVPRYGTRSIRSAHCSYCWLRQATS